MPKHNLGQSVCDTLELARRMDRAAQRLHEVALRVLAVYDAIADGEVDARTWDTPTPDNSDEDMPF
jgi:hypothetical protein